MNVYPQQKLKSEWIHDHITDEAVKWTESFGDFLQLKDSKNPLSTSQVRKFFGELKRIQADPEKYKEDIPLLKAKLAYAVGRDSYKDKRGNLQNKSKINEFYQELARGIDYIREDNRKEDFTRFVKIVESVVAFHKYFGGK